MPVKKEHFIHEIIGQRIKVLIPSGTSIGVEKMVVVNASIERGFTALSHDGKNKICLSRHDPANQRKKDQVYYTALDNIVGQIKTTKILDFTSNKDIYSYYGERNPICPFEEE